MSHFFVGVIVPKGTPDSALDAVVNGLIAKYDENLEVEAYDDECWCKGSAARTRTTNIVASKLGDIDDIRRGYKGNNWQEDIAAPRQKLYEETFEAQPDKDAPNPKCDECNGTGTIKSTRNPDAKWDWWSYGGRWNGEICNKRRNDEPGFNFPDEYRQPKENVTIVGPDTPIPFALITPDGVWHERGGMGWWGTVSDEKKPEEWEAIVKKAYEQYEGHTIVGLDMHI